ncbi:MAG: ATP-binding protein, partial [Desulfobacterales bacterium]|nr:ATP-binding protein [Desulfobacterales bacterium]
REKEAGVTPAALTEIHEKYRQEKARSRELEEELKRAQKMELIGIMAGGVAHDLNNILSGLVSYPELLLMQIDKNSPLFDPISFINDAGLQAAEIVQDLLTLTRRSIPRTDVINLNNIIHTYFNNPAHRRLEKNHPDIRFSTDSEADLLNIKGSEPHISKVVMNLVTNAAEAVGQFGEVRIQTMNRYVDDPLSSDRELREGEYVVLRVTDDGEGIPKEDLNRIFEPFYTKKQMGRSGSGLGLSVVWHAVKDHNGCIDVQSEPARGTCFELYFPATRESTESATSGFELEPLKGDRERILVIDDVKEQLQIASKCLDMLGYTPFTVNSGEKAVEFLNNRQVDLLILDMQMEPGIDGLETYEKILETHPGQKAIIASGYSETRRVKRALRLGAGQYIKKPYTIQKL